MYTFSEELRKALEASPIPMAYYEYQDGVWNTLLVSDGLCATFRMSRPQMMERFSNGTFESVHPDDVGRVMRICDEFARKLAGCDIVYRRMSDWDGTYHKIHSMGQWHTMPDGTELSVFTYTDFTDSMTEIGELAAAYEFFREDLFYSDPMTGLPNVNYLKQFAGERAEKMRAAGKNPALVFMDVNGMHAYNSRYGLSRGDALMQLIADVLRTEFPDSLITRGTDDHFIMIVHMDGQDAMSRKIQGVNDKVQAGAYGHLNGIRAGVALFDGKVSGEEVLDRAKRAHKWIGANMNFSCGFYSMKMDEEYRMQTYILENFDKALEEGWIKVFYQGIMRISSGKVAALEALARWVDPVHGRLSPAQFIPVLEKHHLLYKLDLYMVEQICREIPSRDEMGLPLQPVSVNFSAQDFDHVHVVEEINGILARYDLGKYGLTPRDFIIEITEQDIATATDGFRAQLIELRANGFRIWIDDFGSGYSSLNVFSRYEFDLIKLDMDLLRHLDAKQGTNREIIRAVVAMARKLGVHTLTEGLETEEQLDFLKEVGCELAQGFYYLVPEPLSSMWAKHNKGVEKIPSETLDERDAYTRKWLDRGTGEPVNKQERK